MGRPLGRGICAAYPGCAVLKVLGILAFVAVAVLTGAWWATRGGGQVDPAAPRSTPPPSAPVAPETAVPPTLVGAPHTAPADATAAAAAADRPTVLTGRVIRLDSRRPVVAASVGVRAGERDLARTSTGPGGRFRLEGEMPDTGPWGDPLPLLVAEAEGLTTLQAMASGRGSIASGDVGDLILEPALTVRGAVRGEDGERVVGARLVVQPSRPAEGAEHRAGSWGEVARRQRAESDADGHFAFTGLPPRPFDLEVRAEGYVSAWYRGRAVADAAWLDVRLRRGGSMHVRVEDPDGDPVVGARVNLYPSYRVVFAGHYKTHLRLDRSTVTDALGRCVLTGLQDRNYQITAQSHGLAGAATYVLPGWSETVVRLTPGWRSSRYVYEDGPGEGGASVPPGLDDTFAWTSWPSEPETPPSAPAPPVPAEVEEGENGEEERSPPPPDRARLHVTVLSAEGVPMPDAYVGFEGTDEAAAITEQDGTAIVTLLPGRYACRVSPIDFGSLAADHHGTVDAEGGVESSFVFRLPLVHAVTVQVQAADGEALSRARLEVLRGEKSKSRWTDSEGLVTLFAERGQPSRC